jgi:dephospho-CoA kinase
MSLTKIGIIGQQCAGKTTAANFICELFDPLSTEWFKFADPIYDTLKAHRQEKNRQFMQQFSDLAKYFFGDDIYVKCFKANVQEREKEIEPLIVGKFPGKRLFICDDIRYKSEFAACKELGFKIISIDAPVAVRKKRAEKQGLDFIENHNSEIEIPEIIYKADYVIVDSGKWLSKPRLKSYLKSALKQFNL